MFKEWRQERAVKRVKSGDGRPLQRFRWWQLLGRSLFYLDLTNADGSALVYAVSVRRGGEPETGEVLAHLFRDGRHHAHSKVPARFPVEGGVIEVVLSEVGMKRCHYVSSDGAQRQLRPDPKSAEGRRARLERNHPALSARIGILSVLVLIVGVGLNLVQIIEPIAQIPPIVENFGTYESPITLPLWLNVTLGLAAAAAATERALGMRYKWYLDGAAT